MLVRAMKHLVNEAMREVDLVQLPATIIHLFNCVVGSKNDSKQIQKKVNELKAGVARSEGSTTSDKKKRRKKKKRNLKQVDCDLLPNTYMTMSTSEVFAKV